MPHGHRLAELRSLEYHRLIGERLERDPEALRRARERVARWLTENGPVDRGRALRWQELLHRPLPELVRALNRDDDDARDLRQNSPFAGILTSQERWRVIRETRSEQGRSTCGGRRSST
ncbi:MAG: hypothetical protein IT201_06885 [Thermoleophilia bacterium]|nr:hypothetical protein [Thermoleophilia bacterium]